MLLAAEIFDYLPFLFPLGFLFVAIFVHRLNQREERRRSDAMRQFAMENGFTFTLGGRFESPALLGTDFFHNKFGLKVRNILEGRIAGTDACVAEVAYGSGKHRVVQTVSTFDVGAALPPFQLKPEGWADRFAERLGMKDIDFDAHPEFSRRYKLSSPDEESARAFFAPVIIAAAESLPPSGYTVAASGNRLLVFHPAKRIPVDQLRKFIDETSLIAQAFTRALGKSSFGW